jgi:transposase
MQSIAGRLLELRESIREAKDRLDELQDDYEPARRIRAFAGTIVGGVVVGEVGDPREFSAAAAFEKAAGLNLVEDTTGRQGQHTNQHDAPPVRISKRGSSRARKYLFVAVQRWIKRCEVARAWYQRKVKQHAGCDSPSVVAMVALMRKMIRLLYHLGRGAEYEPEKLFDIRRLDLDGHRTDQRTDSAAE